MHRKTMSDSPTGHSSCHPSYNPRTNECNYDDNETPNIADLYSEEVYNNIY